MGLDLFNPITVTLVLTGVIFWGVSSFMEKSPPKSINHLYGYRTKRSMASKEAWDFAQIYSNQVMNKVAFYLIGAGAFRIFLSGFSEWFEVIIAVLISIAASIHIIIETERELKSRFGQ